MTMCDDRTLRRCLYLTFLIVCVIGELFPTQEAVCTDANPVFIDDSSFFFHENDTTVYPVQYGDCSFETSLCNYTQLCKDLDAENRKPDEDYAESSGEDGYEDTFSVLVSPILNISHLTCLTFEYTQDLPGMLAVYVASNTNLIEVQSEVHWIQSFQMYQAEISTNTGKLVFRARSPNGNHDVWLHRVKMLTGSCTGPRYFVYVIYPTTKATLTTTLVQSTGSQTGCLEFSYIICGRELRLLVSIQSLDGNRRVVWLMFENVPTMNSSGLIAVDSVRYTIVSPPSACPLAPQHANPRDDDVISSLSTSSTQRLSGDISTVSESADHAPASTTTFFQSTTSWSGDVTAVSRFTLSSNTLSENSKSDQTTPIIAGVVSVTVIVIACIVAVVIIVIRKRRQKLEGAKIMSDETYGNANDVHYASEHPVVETTMEDRTDKAAFSDPENDPYDVAEDGVPGITRTALSGNRRYILSPDDTARSCPISQKSPKQRKGATEMHSAVHNQQKGVPEVYSQVHKEKKEAQEVYSLVHKQRKEEINKSSGQGSTAGSLLNPSYTPEIYELANPQPTLAMADTADDQEYNALNFDLDRQVGESSHPREATGQTYDHLHGDVLYDCAKVEHNPHGVNMVIDAEYNHLV